MKLKHKKGSKLQKGITLIALVITIIVLLILAGVSIATLTGDNGILTKTQTAKEETQKASEEEQRQLAQFNATMNTENYDYQTEDNKTVKIPAGFAPTQIDGENSVEEGLVVTDEKGNEFVWIPVPKVVVTEDVTQTTGIRFQEDDTPMALERIENGTKKYRGILYDNWDTSNNTVDVKVNDENPSNIEPSLVTENGDRYDAIEENLTKAGNFKNKEEFLNQMQSDYNEMIESVAKYEGFYVARYEMSYENGKVQYQKGKTSYFNNTHETEHWYGYYKKQREFANNSAYGESIGSSMIWGSQYDAMINWMAKNGIDVTDNKLGNKKNIDPNRITGNTESDKLLNVYDLLGNSGEWTLEASNASDKTTLVSRIIRGGYFFEDVAPGGRTRKYPTIDQTFLCSRGSLFVK